MTIPPPPERRSEPRETSLERFKASEVIRGLIGQLREGVFYQPPPEWTQWADAFAAGTATPDMAADAYYAVTNTILALPSALTPEYARAEAARLVARAAQALAGNPHGARRVGEAAAIFIALTPEEQPRAPD